MYVFLPRPSTVRKSRGVTYRISRPLLIPAHRTFLLFTSEHLITCISRSLILTMYALRPATSPLSAIVRLTRTLHTTPQPLASQPESASKPQMTQTHSTRKSQDPMHKDADIGSGYVRAGRSAREGAESSSSGEAEPFDAARQGNPGGEVKQSTAQSDVAGTGDARMSGSFKDQVGGQDERDKGPGVFSGEKERAAAHGLGQTMGDSIKGSFDGLKEMRSVGLSLAISCGV